MLEIVREGTVLRFVGKKTFFRPIIKQIEVDGLFYTNRSMEECEVDYESEFVAGNLNCVQIDWQGHEYKFYYYNEWDFQSYTRLSISSFVGQYLTCFFRFMGFETHWGKSVYVHINDSIKSNLFYTPVCFEHIGNCGGCHFYLKLSYQELIKYKLLSHIELPVYGVTNTQKQLFTEPLTDSECVDRLISFVSMSF